MASVTPSSSAHVPFRRSSKSSSNFLVGVIDVGTSLISFRVYTTPDFVEVASQAEHYQMFSPQNGWFEQDPKEMIDVTYSCIHEVIRKLKSHGFSTNNIETIGITNQRETTIIWDSITGEPLYNALVWQDNRTTVTVDRILARLPEQNKDAFKGIAGLPVSPYFSALKIRWLKDNVPAIRKACREGHCKAGTVDSWIVWNLTKGGLHITDVTNASRTLLMNIETLEWDPVLLKTFSIHPDMLPEIRSCSEIYGNITNSSSGLKGIRISGIVGNQQASLLGQMCIKPGMAKNTYRSGCFLLCNTGREHVISTHGLLTTVAYKLGPNAPANYALEGAVAVGGYALTWLRDKVRLLPEVLEAEKMAASVPTTGDVYFVPAFTGLYAPYWRNDARGTICGLTQFTTKSHIVRAALESICYQTRDIIECMFMEGGFQFSKLQVDGIGSSNNLLMQLQADIAGVPVFRSKLADATPFGAALCAGLASGIDLVKLDETKRHHENVAFDTFLPTSTEDERKVRYGKWKRAVERSMGWAIKSQSSIMTNRRYRLLASIPAGIFLITAFGFLIHSARSR